MNWHVYTRRAYFFSHSLNPTKQCQPRRIYCCIHTLTVHHCLRCMHQHHPAITLKIPMKNTTTCQSLELFRNFIFKSEKHNLYKPAQIIVSNMLWDRPPLTSDSRHVSISSNGTAAARRTGAKLFWSSAILFIQIFSREKNSKLQFGNIWGDIFWCKWSARSLRIWAPHPVTEHHVPGLKMSVCLGRQMGLTCVLKLMPASLLEATLMIEMSLLYGPLRRNSGCITIDSIRNRRSYISNFFKSWFPITKCKYGCCDNCNNKRKTTIFH